MESETTTYGHESNLGKPFTENLLGSHPDIHYCYLVVPSPSWPLFPSKYLCCSGSRAILKHFFVWLS